MSKAVHSKHLHGIPFVQNVVVTGPKEQVDDSSKTVDVLAIGFTRETVCIDPRAWASIKVSNLEDEVDRLEEDIAECLDTEVLDLAVGDVDTLAAVTLDTIVFGNEGVKCGSVGLQVRSCKKTKVVNQAVCNTAVVPLLLNQYLCKVGVVHVLCYFAQKIQHLICPVFIVLVVSDCSKQMIHAHKPSNLTLNLSLVARFNKLLEVAETNCY